MKLKVIQLQARTGLEGSWSVRRSQFMTTAQDGGKVVRPTQAPNLLPTKYLSQPESDRAFGGHMSMKNHNYTIGNRYRDFPACSAVP